MHVKRLTALICGLFLAGPVAADPGLQMPKFETVVLENGLTLQLMRRATVPMVAMELWIPAGASQDPEGKEGLATLTAEALRKGAGKRDAEAFAGAIDFLGASFNTSVNKDRVRVAMNFLAKDLDQGLELFSDALLRPMFDSAEIGKLAAQMAEGVLEAKDNPRNVIGDYHSAFLFGGHPYANPVDGTETSLSEIQQSDVREFYEAFYGSDRAVLSVVGDIDLAVVRSKVEKVFGEMSRAKSELKTIPEPDLPGAPRVLLVNKNDTPQTWFRIGALGPEQGAPDFAAAEVVRTIFGGRFTSWLNSKLRIESGLTYGAGYRFAPGFVPGSAYISSFTATETTKEAIDLALAQLDRLHDEGIGDEDLASAKAYLKGQTPYEYETARNLAGKISELCFYGLDRSRVDRLFEEIDAVDTAACQEVIDRYFRRENLVITAIGVQAKVADILGEYGELKIRENGDPGFR